MNPPAARFPTGSLLQALVSALGVAACAVGAGFTLVSALMLLASGNALYREQAGILITLTWTLTILSLVGLPSLVHASRHIAGQPAGPSEHTSLRRASLAMLLWPVVLATGQAVSKSGELAWVFLPPLQALAVGLPLWWLVEIARDRLPAFSPKRNWGVLNFSLFVSTPLVILAEIFLALCVLTAVVLLISTSPELQQAFEAFSRRVLNSVSNPEALLRLYRPLLGNPWVIFALFAGLCGIIPLIEEALKPLAVWVLGARKLTPAGGFVVGALSGAGFALLETLFSLVSPLGDGWLWLAVGRAGTGLLHITTAALMGYALTEAWSEGRFLRLGLIYFGVVCLHGLWNALSVLSTLAALASPDAASVLQSLGQLAPYGLGLLAGLCFVLLLAFNRSLRRQSSVTLTPQAG